MKKRTWLLLLAFFLLGGISWWYMQHTSPAMTTMAGWDRDFAVENTEEIHKIFLANREGSRVTLERRDGHWLYNGTWKARPDAMRNLLDAISRIRMKYKPPKAMEENMIKSLATRGIKVELYDRRDQLIKAYYVGGATTDERGTFLMREGADQPYVGELANWEGNLRFRFNLEGDDWRDKSVFFEPIETVRSVSIVYPKQKSKSFMLKKEGDEYQVEPYFETTPRIKGEPARGLVESFLLGFEQLGAEAFENANPRRDSIRQLLPFSIITVTKTDGTEKVVKLHPIHPKGIYEARSGQLVAAPAVERYFADCSNGDFMLVQHRVFRDILWAYDFFFETQ